MPHAFRAKPTLYCFRGAVYTQVTSQNVKLTFCLWPKHPPTLTSSVVLYTWKKYTRHYSIASKYSFSIRPPTHPTITSIWYFALSLGYERLPLAGYLWKQAYSTLQNRKMRMPSEYGPNGCFYITKRDNFATFHVSSTCSCLSLLSDLF